MKKILTVAALMLFAYVQPTGAQEVTLEGAYTHVGPPTEEPDNRVRIGSASQIDLSYAITLSGTLTDHLDGYVTTRLMPTNLCVWEREDGFERPMGCDHGMLWSTFSFGVEYRFASAGLGAASISGAKHDFWGAVPMTAPLVEIGVRPTWSVGELRVGPTCTGQAILPRVLGDGFTVLERAAGVGPEEPLERGGRNFVTLNCGVSVGVE